MGLGLYENGSGIAATKFLLSAGAKITITDLKTKAQLADQIKRLGPTAKKVKFVLGEHRKADFINADLVVRNPGVPKSSAFLALARKNKIPIETDITLFLPMVERKRVLAVTGTRGKSTTTSWLYEMIKTKDQNAVLAGNIIKSPLAQLSAIKKGGPVVLELSSWLLEDMAAKKISPHIAVFTNIYPDHLNTYKDLDEYIDAKANIFRYQNLQDYLIINKDNAKTEKLGHLAPGQRFWFSLKRFEEENGCFIDRGEMIFRQNGEEVKISKIKEISLPGEHNLANALGAAAAAMIYGVKAENIRKVLKSFKGVSSRQELIREIGGVKYYNDTTSTTPEATIAALKTLSKKQENTCPQCFAQRSRREKAKKQIVLIAGGSDKSLDFKELAREIKNTCKAVVFLKGTGTERLSKMLKTKNYQLKTTKVDSMKEAIKAAQSFAKKRDVVLLSPACASFGMFNNEFDRGGQFNKIVRSLK